MKLIAEFNTCNQYGYIVSNIRIYQLNDNLLVSSTKKISPDFKRLIKLAAKDELIYAGLKVNWITGECE